MAFAGAVPCTDPRSDRCDAGSASCKMAWLCRAASVPARSIQEICLLERLKRGIAEVATADARKSSLDDVLQWLARGRTLAPSEDIPPGTIAGALMQHLCNYVGYCAPVVPDMCRGSRLLQARRSLLEFHHPELCSGTSPTPSEQPLLMARTTRKKTDLRIPPVV